MQMREKLHTAACHEHDQNKFTLFPTWKSFAFATPKHGMRNGRGRPDWRTGSRLQRMFGLAGSPRFAAVTYGNDDWIPSSTNLYNCVSAALLPGTKKKSSVGSDGMCKSASQWSAYPTGKPSVSKGAHMLTHTERERLETREVEVTHLTWGQTAAINVNLEIHPLKREKKKVLKSSNSCLIS